ncbi:hypothetical protein QOU18_26580 [Pseudomonas aeruginosa]
MTLRMMMLPGSVASEGQVVGVPAQALPEQVGQRRVEGRLRADQAGAARAQGLLGTAHQFPGQALAAGLRQYVELCDLSDPCLTVLDLPQVGEDETAGMLLGLRQPEQAVARGGQEQCLDRLLVAGIQGFPGFADIGLPERGHRGDVVGAGQANPVLLWRRIELLADPQQVAVGIDQGEFAHAPGLVFQGRDAWNPLTAQAEGLGLAM